MAGDNGLDMRFTASQRLETKAAVAYFIAMGFSLIAPLRIENPILTDGVFFSGGARHVKSEQRAASTSAREIVSVPSLKL